MRGNFQYLRFKTFPMTPRTLQCKVFWALLSNSKHSKVPEDSKSQLWECWASPPHLAKVGLQQVHSWNIFGAKISHGQLGFTGLTRLTTTRTWRKPPPSPLSYTLRLSTRPTSKWHFVLKLPSGSPKIVKVRTPTTLGTHNFTCKHRIEMRFETKL